VFIIVIVVDFVRLSPETFGYTLVTSKGICLKRTAILKTDENNIKMDLWRFAVRTGNGWIMSNGGLRY
jgi:hypothetical protein